MYMVLSSEQRLASDDDAEVGYCLIRYDAVTKLTFCVTRFGDLNGH